jgi:PAS domain S-box-containing protein
MKKEDLFLAGTVSLRQKAEKQYEKKHSAKKPTRNEADTMRHIHELEVHQIELEMQYEELKMAEAKAETAAEKFATLYDFAPVGYFTLNNKGKICELNLNGARMLEKERSVLVNSYFRQFITSETLPVFNDFFGNVFKTHSKQTCEVSLKLFEDLIISVHIDGISSMDDHEVLITLTDTTKSIQIEEKLQNSEERYRRLFETAKDGILILDAYNGQIVDVNPFLIEILGYTYNEFLGKELWEIGIFKNIEDSKAAFIELQDKGYIRYEDMPLETKHGKPINVEYVSNVYLVEKAKVIQCNIRDITDRKKAELALKKSEASLRELNATKDKFFSIIAHDLKSPFNGIIGLSDLLVEKVHKKEYAKIEEIVVMLQNSSWRAMDLLKNLLDWSRSQSGKMEFNKVKINPSELINEVIELLNDSAIQKSITIAKYLPAGITVFADISMFNTIIRNLISNAIKYTNPGGKIDISVFPGETELIISVSDNGVGIKKDEFEKLFLIEAGGSTSCTQGEEGTGLGLILCRDFVLKHGGRIWAESEPGQGSRFIFTLPAK